MKTNVRGFTLIEVLTSLAICLALAGLATTTFMQVRSVLRRTQARLELHNSARFIYNTMRTDLLAMQQDGALFIETVKDAKPGDALGAPTHTGEVRLTFLRGKIDNDTSNEDKSWDLRIAPPKENSDLVWTQWAFRQNLTALCSGSNSRIRFVAIDIPWKDGKFQFGGNPADTTMFGQLGFWTPGDWQYAHYYEMMPNPRRVAGPDARTTLDDNSFKSGHRDDIGDYTDLIHRIAPVTRGVTAFDLQAVLTDGSVIDATIGTDSVTPFDGEYVDGRIGTVVQPYRRRPRLIRIRFDLTDFSLSLTQSFSFSFAVPGPHPPL